MACLEIQEHKTESGDTVSVYTDVTERRQFIERLLEAKQQAERASEESAEKNRMLEALSNKLSKYLAPQVYSSISQAATALKCRQRERS